MRIFILLFIFLMPQVVLAYGTALPHEQALEELGIYKKYQGVVSEEIVQFCRPEGSLYITTKLVEKQYALHRKGVYVDSFMGTAIKLSSQPEEFESEFVEVKESFYSHSDC